MRGLKPLLCLISALAIDVSTAQAQYMFLDFDGDGVYTTTDTYAGFSNADTLNVDLYVVTDQDPYGNPSVCADESSLDIDSYYVHLRALSAPASFIEVTNRMPGMVPLAPVLTEPTALTASFGGTTRFPSGKHLLMSLQVAFGPGCPNLTIAPNSCYSPTDFRTGFGSGCAGAEGDYILRLGEDFADARGSEGCTDLPPQTPKVTCPESVQASAGEAIRYSVTVDARDCQLHAFYANGLPAGATVTWGPLMRGQEEAIFEWTPSPGQQGTYFATFVAFNPDWFNNRNQTDSCSTLISVGTGSQAPITGSGGPLRMTVAPNPVNAASWIEFTTERTGAASVRLFDLHGRVAATLMNESALAPGRHEISFAALNRRGIRLASGVYFVRVTSEHDGEEIRRVTVLK